MERVKYGDLRFAEIGKAGNVARRGDISAVFTP
jgi:hypothetical protein